MTASRIMLVVLVLGVAAGQVFGACCYFAAQDKDVNQPGQKAFITWDPREHRESFTVQPAFEGDARDFGMVVPTPAQPKLDEMPRDFFKQLAVFTILLPMPQQIYFQSYPMPNKARMAFAPGPGMMQEKADGALGVRVLEAGVVGSLDYKIITAEDASGLFQWLSENKYNYGGDKPTLDHYIQRKWIFTVMKIDTKQMKTGADGKFLGEVTPTRFAFASDTLVYPLKITAISVKKNTEALFYVQAPEQMDLEGNWSWAWSYRVMWLNSGTVCISQKQMTDAERNELGERQKRIDEMRAEVPGFDTTKLEWARRLGMKDMAVLDEPAANYSQLGIPDKPDGAHVVDVETMKKELWDSYTKSNSDPDPAGRGSAGESYAKAELERFTTRYAAEKGKIVRAAPSAESKEPRFYWFPNREAPEADVNALSKLKGHLTQGAFLCKFRKSFTKGEMKKDLDIVPAEKEVQTEYFRVLPQSPP